MIVTLRQFIQILFKEKHHSFFEPKFIIILLHTEICSIIDIILY